MTNEELLQLIKVAAAEKLEKLDLCNKQLRSLPPEIGQLTSLRSINLQGNYLSGLPRELGLLISLQSLNLKHNLLSSLPPEIGQLFNLQTLDLSYNDLTHLSSAIGQLKHLRLLYLRGNRLKFLPAAIGQLSELRSLYLGYARLNELPPEVGQLASLELLDLSINQLRRLPSEIGQLSELKSLYLGYNYLSYLPTEISHLFNLSSLDISDNNLGHLPPQLGQLSNLKLLYLGGNSTLDDPPPEIINDGTAAILNYLRQQIEQGRDYLYEAKLLIVGEGAAGKTSLAKKLEDSAYPLSTREASTEGIDVIRWEFQLKDDTPFCLNIWDFGGQEVYHETHQFFLTKRSLYVLVIDTRRDNTDLHYWLSIVDLLSNSSPILIIKNEKQDRTCQINERALRAEFLNLKEIAVTNLATNRGLEGVVQSIQHYASQLEHVGTPLPKKWVDVRRTLETDDRNYISLNEYFEICEKNGFERRDDQLQLSDYLHDLGVCLHFQDELLLKKVIILKPEWGTAAVYKVLDTPEVVNEQGCFSRIQLNQIWSERQYADMRDELLQLMMRFKLCYQIPTRPGTYIAPNLLSVEQPDYDWDDTQNLTLRYTYEFMPKGIVTRFIVEMHPWIEEQSLVWKSGVVLGLIHCKSLKTCST